MKKILILLPLVAGLALVSCNNTSAPAEATAEGEAPAKVMTAKDYVSPKAEIDSVSYLMGVNFGLFMKSYGFEGLNYNQMVAAMKDVLAAEGDARSEEFMKSLKYPPTSINNAFNTFLDKKRQREALQGKEESEAFLAKNAKKAGITVLESGLQYQILEAGNDVHPTVSDTVYVNYTGTLIDGTEFDSATDTENPLAIPLKSVIKGWQEGLPLIGEGGHIVLYVPSDLGYGTQGNPVIKPNSALVFDVTLQKVGKFVPAPEETPAVPAKKK